MALQIQMEPEVNETAIVIPMPVASEDESKTMITIENERFITFIILLSYFDLRNYWEKFKTWCSRQGEYEADWYNGVRGWAGAIATFTGGASLFMGFNPPGGYVQVSAGDKIVPCSRNDLIAKISENRTTLNCAGEAVLGIVYPEQYLQLSVSSGVGLLASAFIILLVASGVPLNRRTPAWILSVSVCVAMLCTFNMFAQALLVLPPEAIWYSATRWMYMLVETMVLMLADVIILLTIRHGIWKCKDIAERKIPVKTKRILFGKKL